jgi:hypothetical protein
MKLRIKGDTLRLRLTQSEVRHLAETGAVSDALHLPGAPALVYALRAADVPALRAERSPDALTVHIPQPWVAPWADGDGVGFSGEQDLGGGRALGLLVEKDFACLDPRADESDAFPNPRADAC